MKLQAKDLMIGDWVRVSDLDKYVRVNAVYPAMICPNPHDDDVHPVIGDEYLQPIPLTPEILEKNGWLETDEPMVIFSGVGKWERKYNVFKYVHELQHALKLCGIEKQIEL